VNSQFVEEIMPGGKKIKGIKITENDPEIIR
jgi:hypothetical protein